MYLAPSGLHCTQPVLIKKKKKKKILFSFYDPDKSKQDFILCNPPSLFSKIVWPSIFEEHPLLSQCAQYYHLGNLACQCLYPLQLSFVLNVVGLMPLPHIQFHASKALTRATHMTVLPLISCVLSRSGQIRAIMPFLPCALCIKHSVYLMILLLPHISKMTCDQSNQLLLEYTRPSSSSHFQSLLVTSSHLQSFLVISSQICVFLMANSSGKHKFDQK